MLVNIIGFNLSWFGLVFIGNSFIPVTLIWLFYHLYNSINRRTELLVIVIVALIGGLVDAFLTYWGIFAFNESSTIPYWLVTLWLAFGATINHSLSLISESKAAQLIIGFIFPPLSYLTGASFSVVELPYGVSSTYIVLAPIWAVLLVVIFHITKLINVNFKLLNKGMLNDYVD